MSIPEPLLQEFSLYLSRHIGLWFPPGRWADLVRGMTRLAQARGLSDAQTCMRRMILAVPEQADIEMLALYLSVGETYFFRDPALFKALEYDILPDLINQRRLAGNQQIKLWSAGCCTGEELYSVLILLTRLLPDFERWELALLGTDINPDFLAKAACGEFRDWSFRNLPPQIKQRYFTPTAEGRYAILPSLKNQVTFQHHNLASASFPEFEPHRSGVDLILCRNVLMYFNADQMQQTVNLFHRRLHEGGWLIVTAVEGGNEAFNDFQQVMAHDALLYRKTAGQGAAPVALELSTYPEDADNGYGVLLETISCHAVPEAPPPSLAHPRDPNPVTNQATGPALESSYEIALRHYAQGEYPQVVTTLLADEPSHPAHLMLLARAYANSGDLARALQWAGAALSADKCDPVLRYLLALILEEDGQHVAAIESFKHALYLDPEFALAHFGLGSAYRRLGQLEAARRHFNNATTLLRKTPASQILTESDGMTAGQLIEIIQLGERIS